MRTEWPATRREWLAAVVRFLSGWAMIERPQTQSATRAVIRSLASMVQEYEDRGGDPSDAIGDVRSLEAVYEHIRQIKLSARARGMIGAAGRADELLSYYTQIAGLGCTLTPLPPAGNG